MSKSLIIVKAVHQGNTMFNRDTTSCYQQIFYTKQETLDSFCEKVIDKLKEFNDSSNFKKEVAKISNQLENTNFAQIRFDYPNSIYDVTIVAPKFEKQ